MVDQTRGWCRLTGRMAAQAATGVEGLRDLLCSDRIPGPFLSHLSHLVIVALRCILLILPGVVTATVFLDAAASESSATLAKRPNMRLATSV
jgi:hypothetical protein